MILNGKRFERGFCPSCSKHRQVYIKDGLCYGCGGHWMQFQKQIRDDLDRRQIYDLDHPDVAAGEERRKEDRRK